MSKPAQPRKIIIKPYPWNSLAAHNLVTALDTELEEMYPDWRDLPHPGFPKFVGGDDLETYTANPVPTLTALDAEATTNTIPPTDNTSRTLTPEQISTLHFHIAFDITDDPQGTPIGCMGVKLMPYFPFHRAQPDTETPVTDSPRYAEIKRAYIAPVCRGSLVFTPQSPTEPVRLADAIVRTVQDYARDVLFVDKLVLETGVRQKAAIRLYERLGWTRIADYGDYVGAGVKDGGVSMCYVLDL